MTNDSEELFEKLARQYPELMERSNIGDYIGVEPGWFNIISALCSTIYEPVQQAKYRLQAAKEYPRDKTGKYLVACEEALSREIDGLPCIVQIKEKFGTLRFYYDGGNERTDTLVQFAEAMSARTCEECGAPGTQDNSGWIKTVCEEHRRKNSNFKEDIKEGTILPKIENLYDL